MEYQFLAWIAGGNGTSTVPYPGISIGKVHDATKDNQYPYRMLPIATPKIRARATASLKDMGGGIGGGRGSFNRLSGILLNTLSLKGSFFSS